MSWSKVQPFRRPHQKRERVPAGAGRADNDRPSTHPLPDRASPYWRWRSSPWLSWSGHSVVWRASQDDGRSTRDRMADLVHSLVRTSFEGPMGAGHGGARECRSSSVTAAVGAVTRARVPSVRPASPPYVELRCRHCGAGWTARVDGSVADGLKAALYAVRLRWDGKTCEEVMHAITVLEVMSS